MERYSDFSEVNIKNIENENIKTHNDLVNYKKQDFNFDNQLKLNQNKFSMSEDVSKRLQKEISSYNKSYIPLIQNVQRDVILKGNHLPGPCYYKYLNNSIEGDMLKLNKKNKMSYNKNWK